MSRKPLVLQHLEDTIYQGYNRTMFDVQKYTGIAFRFDGVDEAAGEREILRNQWSGKSFSRPECGSITRKWRVNCPER